MTLAPDELLSRSRETEPWERFAALPTDEAQRLFDAVRERTEKALRADPAFALTASEVLMRAAHRLTDRAALAHRIHAAALHIGGQTQEAVGHYERAMQLFEEAGEELEAARVRRSLVDTYQMVGRAPRALEVADEARAVLAAHGEERLLAQLDVNVGNVHFRLDDYAAARDAYRAGRERFEALGDTLGLAFVDFNLGNVETHAHHFDDAEAAFRSAREELDRAGMTVHVADCDYCLAYLQSRRGRFAAAIQGLEEARAAYGPESKPSGVPLCDKDLAEVYLRLDARHDALDHARRAAAAFTELGLDYERAQSEVLAAQAHQRLGARAAGLACLERAGATFAELGNDVWRTMTELQRYQVLGASGGAALRELRDVCKRLEHSDHALLEEIAQLSLSRALVDAGEAREAIGILRALIARESGSLDELIEAERLQVLADAHIAVGERSPAIEALRAAIQVIDRTYSKVPGSDVRVAFFRDRHATFVQLADLVSQAGGSDACREAIELLERGRARSLARLEGDVAEAPETARFRAAREHLDVLLGQRLDAELGSLRGEEERPPTDTEIQEAHDALRQLARETRTPQVGSAPEVGAFAARLAEDELALVYMPAGEGWCVFTVDRECARRFDLTLTGARLSELTERLQVQLEKYRLGSDYWERHESRLRRSTDRVLAALGDELLGPIAGVIAGRRLIVCPYGKLHGLPFHAFALDGEPLVARAEVGYIPKLGFLSEAACVDGGDVIATGADETSAPEIRSELDAIAELYTGPYRELAPDRLAQEVKAGSLVAGALHIAGHGSFRPASPLFSGVRLGGSFVTAYDVRGSGLDCRLVTLSGCETGREQAVGGEELFGLQRAFLSAGARSVVSSLWTLRDLDSARCMKRLYEHLARGLDVRAALAQAQRELMQESPHPFSWAPFMVSGDPRTRLPGRALRAD